MSACTRWHSSPVGLEKAGRSRQDGAREVTIDDAFCVGFITTGKLGAGRWHNIFMHIELWCVDSCLVGFFSVGVCEAPIPPEPLLVPETMSECGAKSRNTIRSSLWYKP